MRVLHLCDTEDDYMSAVIWHGLAGQCDLFAAGNIPPSCGRIPTDGRGTMDDGGRYDLAVVHSMLTRHRTWQWCEPLVNRCDRVAVVEGWDSATECHVPYFKVDAWFRREVDPSFAYPYQPRNLGFAGCAEWFYDGPKEYDIFFAGNPSHSVRWNMLRQVFATRRRHRSIMASTGFASDYHMLMRLSRLALCPPGAAGCEAFRTGEVVAMGAVPVFVGHPPRIRANWFDNSMSFCCTLDNLADTLDDALGADLEGMRRRLADHFHARHTTAARAKEILDVFR